MTIIIDEVFKSTKSVELLGRDKTVFSFGFGSNYQQEIFSRDRSNNQWRRAESNYWGKVRGELEAGMLR